MPTRIARSLSGSISIKRTPEAGTTIAVNAANLTVAEAEQLGALLGAEARAQRSIARRSRYVAR